MPLWFPFFDSSTFFLIALAQILQQFECEKKLLIKEPNCTESSWQQALHWNKLHFHKRLWPSLYVTGNENSVLNKISNNNKAHKEQFSPLPLEEGKHFPLDFRTQVRVFSNTAATNQRNHQICNMVKKKKNRVLKVQANSRPFNVTKDSVHYFTFYSSKVHVIQNETKAERLLTLSPFVVTINAD